MPLTYAHPAAAAIVHALVRQRLSLTALVIGSVVPDIVLFVPIPLARADTHSMFALIWFCVPVGLLCYLIYDRLLRACIVSALPIGVQERLADRGDRAADPGMTIPLSVGLGALTHIVWDSMTHENGFVVARVPELQTNLLSLGAYDLRVYGLLQHSSTLIGTAILAWMIYRWYKRTAPRCSLKLASERSALPKALILAAPVIIGLAAAVAALDSNPSITALQHAARAGVVYTTNTFFLVALIVSTLRVIGERIRPA